MLKVKLLEAGAKAPTVTNPGEDLGYDLYALHDIYIVPGTVHKVRTGIAVEAAYWIAAVVRSGLIIKDRSSMASKGVFTHGGVIDSGYRGEIVVLMSTVNKSSYRINAGDKIAQMIPVPVITDGEIVVVDELTDTSRGENGLGSSGSR